MKTRYMQRFFFIIFVFCMGNLVAQESPTGRLIINKPYLMDSLQAYDQLHKSNQKLDGFRIQIFMESGNESVVRANEVIEQFKESFPDIPAYLSFGQPYYRVRVGDYRNRLEAEGQLRFIARQFNQAFVTKDLIEMPHLPSFPTNTNSNEQTNPYGD